MDDRERPQKSCEDGDVPVFVLYYTIDGCEGEAKRVTSRWGRWRHGV